MSFLIYLMAVDDFDTQENDEAMILKSVLLYSRHVQLRSAT